MNPAENQVPAVWNVGDVILDLYEVKNIHEGGGMGLVYRVHHRGWNMDLAVKSPRSEFFQTDRQKETFVRECETWINLGLHPHVASCYYVRTLGNIPRIFAEYVEGGTLREWIDSRKLYEGGPQVALKRILDIAIQIAWGLQYAHEQGLIHQDVKPANVLMTPEGAAKVTDFGLANARAAAGESSVGAGHRSIFVSSGGMTPAYCSPEQAEAYAKRVAGISTGDLPKLTRRTDIWSWGVTVLEMFIGEVCWQSGVAAPIVLQQYQELKRAISPDIPTLLYQLLSECFEFQPDRRPGQFSEIANRVRATFEKIYETTHPRELSAQVPANADLLNNQALSMVDLGRAFDPAPLKGGGKDFYSLLLKALSSNPGHIIARLNHSLFNWRMVGTNIAVSQRTVQNDLRGNLNSDLAKWGASLLAEQFQPRLAIAFLRQFPDGLDYRLTEDLEKLAANLKAALRDYFNTESEFSETPETFFRAAKTRRGSHARLGQSPRSLTA